MKTVAVLPFENFTSQANLTSDVNTTVRDAVEGRLGLRSAGERQADAVVRGTITRYEDDVPLAYTGGAAGQGSAVQVTKRQVELTVNIEITDQKSGAVLWQRTGLTVRGDYAGQSINDGLHKALDMLASNIVEGAQSQW
ncbi:MAG TPA: LPS assembly lipoprotein LptE [Gemmatimonadales bacterium]|nr:LPS assembly lipoprotein LptE [Gemmatimonadales bacterium]